MNDFTPKDDTGINGTSTRPMRHPMDSRIALVDRIEDAPRIGGLFNVAHGVICPHRPYTDAQLQEIVDYARARLKKGTANYFRPVSTGPDPAPQALIDIYKDMQGAFHRVTGYNRSGIVRINSRFPQQMHAHEPTLTYTFSDAGTIAENKRGKRYTIPAGHIFIFDQKIWHMAAQTLSADMPRITIVI